MPCHCTFAMWCVCRRGLFLFGSSVCECAVLVSKQNAVPAGSEKKKKDIPLSAGLELFATAVYDYVSAYVTLGWLAFALYETIKKVLLNA